MKKVKQYKYIILIAILVSGLILYWFQFRTETKSEPIDIDKAMEAIKQVESSFPPRIGKNPTDEEIYDSPYIKQIRVALNGYLDGTNAGVEDGALDATTDEMKCGLNNFSKTDYKGKFVIITALDNDYGGVQAYITFVDNPYKVFWVWVYLFGPDEGQYVLRAICEDKPPTTEQKKIIDKIVVDSDYYL